MKITETDYNALPDTVKAHYQKLDDGYVHSSEIKFSDLKSNFDRFDEKYKATAAELKSFKDGEADKIAAARAEAEADALAQAVKTGDTAEVKRRHGEQMAEMETRYKGEVESLNGQFAEREKKLSGMIREREIKATVSGLAEKLGIVPESRPLFENNIKSLIDYDVDTGKRIYLDRDGSATALDDKAFFEAQAADSAYDCIRVKAVNSGGDAKGSNSSGGGAAKHMTSEQFNAMSHEERSASFSAGARVKSD